MQTRGLLLLIFVLLVNSCAAQERHIQQHNNYFYLGLLSDSQTEKADMFEKALVDSNVYIRRAAAEELAVLMLNGAELSAETQERLRREASGLWAAAFDAAGGFNRERYLSFLLGFEQNAAAPFALARVYVLNEFERRGLTFTGNELAAIDGHYAVARLRYNDALNSFRAFRVNGRWPARMPQMFFEHPNLINDLGRTFQFTPAGNEGLPLFLQWEANLPSQADDLRYRLVFFAARIARRLGQNEQAVSLFERALTLAPDYEQQDAGIWYILDLSMGGPVNVTLERLERLIPLWHNDSSYNNILERYLHRLVTDRDWGRIVRTYDLIKNTRVVTRAGYAWLIARALEEGFLSAAERQMAARAANVAAATPAVFYRIAYNAGESLLMPGLYYRMQSADALGLPLLVFSEENIPCCFTEELPPTDAIQFLLGFFYNGAGSFSAPYIRSMETTLLPCELRAVSQALNRAEMYPLSMRLITFYFFRPGHVRQRRDLELMYPRPYLELIETNARRFDIAPSLLFGLVRTESAFQSAVVSHAGAVGLSQLMPATAREQADRIRRGGGPNFFGPNNTIDSTDPYLNVYIGSSYYNFLLGRFNNNKQLALMSYNGGQTRVRRWFNANNLPVDLFVETAPIFETRDYGRRVPAIGRIYEELYYR